VITAISFIDFTVFFLLFLAYMLNIQCKTKVLSTRVINGLLIVFFILFKGMHLPVFISTIEVLNWTIPGSNVMLAALTWTNVLLSILPLGSAILSLFSKTNPKLEPYSKELVNIVMPIYNEIPESLENAVESVLAQDYPKDKIHLWLSFDDDGEPEAYKYLVRKWNLDYCNALNFGTNITHCTKNEVKVSICRFAHGGKKSAQHSAIKLIEYMYTEEELNNSLLFFIDSDIILQKDVLVQFCDYMKRYNKNVLTGLISCITSSSRSFLSLYQDIEYVSGQVFWRNFENYMGSPSCLPGAFTILKWNSFKNVSKEYFTEHVYRDNIDYQRFYLGEDRYLTHLLMESESWKIGYCANARCKTEAPEKLYELLKQRKRWFLGFFANDTWMLSSLKVWKTYPALCIFNLLNVTRNTSIYIYLLYLVLLFNKEVNVLMWFLMIILPVLTNWVFIFIYSFKIKRKMNVLFYILILILQPLFSMMYMYYTLFTISNRSWGGVRVDKDKLKNKDVVEVV
jgi:chitin synthase